MAKQSSLFNFFIKSPPPVSSNKTKVGSPSPAEADVPSSVHKSNSSPKEQAQLTAPPQQQNNNKSSKVTPRAKTHSKSVKGGFTKLFGDKAPAAKER